MNDYYRPDHEDKEPQEEATDFDDPKEVDKVFDKMTTIEKDLAALDERGRNAYSIGYKRCVIDILELTEDVNLSRILNTKLAEAERRNYCD